MLYHILTETQFQFHLQSAIVNEIALFQPEPGKSDTKLLNRYYFDNDDPVHCLICASSGLDMLTHLPLDKMATILQTIVSDVFLWMKSIIFWLKFHWNLFLRV